MMANNNNNNNNEDMATMNELIEMKDFLEKAINHISKSEDEKDNNYDIFTNYLTKAENEISKIAYFKSIFESSPIINSAGKPIYYITFNALTDKYQANECKFVKPVGIIYFNSKTIAELCADWLNFAREHERGDNCKT